MNLCMLAAHEERCKGVIEPARKAVYRVELGVLPNTIVVARSSSSKPKGWETTTGSIEAGLPLWAGSILRRYAQFSTRQLT